MANNNPIMVLIFIVDSFFLAFYAKFLTPTETHVDGDEVLDCAYFLDIYPKQMLIEYYTIKSRHTYRVRFNKDGHLCIYNWGELSKPLKPNGKLEKAFKAYYSEKFEDIFL